MATHKIVADHARLDAENTALRAQIEQLPLLVKIAAREQRYKCLDWLHTLAHGILARIQNTPCPDPEPVLELWRREVAS